MENAFLGALTRFAADNKPAPQPKVEAPAAMSQELAPVKAKQSAAMEAMPGIGLLRGPIEALDGFKIPLVNATLPIGSAVVGGLTGFVVGEVVDVVISQRTKEGGVNWINVGANGLAAGVLVKFGPGVMGHTASNFAAGIIILNLALRLPGVQDNLAKLISAIAKPVAGIVPKMGQGSYSAVSQAGTMARQVPGSSGHDQLAGVFG
ncbi:MAG: hypothetical protein Q8R28_11260 [Dehalococcoidia bacterium]|nr:hypothetical protein [Dehalococcoidia bacterium]